MTRMYVNISVISCSMCFASLTVMLLLFAMEMTLQRQWKAKSRIDWKLTSRYIEKLRHSIEKINKRHKLEESKKKELEESKKESELSWWLFFISRNTANGKQDTPKESLLQPLQLPPRVSRVPTMVIRLVPATDLLDNALRSYGYSPLLELTVRPTLTVRSLFVHSPLQAQQVYGLKIEFRVFATHQKKCLFWVIQTAFYLIEWRSQRMERWK